VISIYALSRHLKPSISAISWRENNIRQISSPAVKAEMADFSHFKRHGFPAL
jgi:hypothetical protein